MFQTFHTDTVINPDGVFALFLSLSVNYVACFFLLKLFISVPLYTYLNTFIHMLPVCMMQCCNTPKLLSCVNISNRLKTELVISLYSNYFFTTCFSELSHECYISHKKRFIFINTTKC